MTSTMQPEGGWHNIANKTEYMPKPAPDAKWDLFLSHKQENGGAQCHTLFQHLTHALGLNIWYDNDAERLNAAGMEEGVKQSSRFLLFVTTGIFDRPWCLKELNWAIKYNKPIVVMYESDISHGGMNVGDLINQSPELIRGLLLDEEWLKFSSELFAPSVDMLLQRCTIAPPPVAVRNVFESASKTSMVTPKQLSAQYHPGTRKWLFDAIREWLAGSSKDSSWSQIFTLDGQTGVGKSVFAAQLCVRGSQDFPELNVKDSPEVAGFHFFKHDNADDMNPRNALLSIASQLRRSIPGFAVELHKMSGLNSDGLGEKVSLKQLFTKIISKPASLLDRTKRAIVVIDALDECEKGKADEFMTLIQHQWVKEAPSWLGLVVTSRPEYQQGWSTAVTSLDTANPRNKEDIKLFIREKLESFAATKEDLDAMVDRLLVLSDGLFLYMRFLDDIIKEARANRRVQSKRRLSLAKRLSRSNKVNDDDKKLTAADFVDLPKGLSGMFAVFFQQISNALTASKYQKVLSPIADAREAVPLLLWIRCVGYDKYRGTNSRKDRKASNEFAKVRQETGNLLMEIKDPVTGTPMVRFVHKSMSDWLTGGADDTFESAFKLGYKELCVSAKGEGHVMLCEQMSKLMKEDSEHDMVGSARSFAVRHRFYHLCQLEKFEQAAAIVFTLDSLVEWLKASAAMGKNPADTVLSDIESHIVGNEVAAGLGNGLVEQATMLVNVLRVGSGAIQGDQQAVAAQIVAQVSESDVEGKGKELIQKLREQAVAFTPEVN